METLIESKSVRRLRFESEVQGIIRRHGDLETMRNKLNMSRREISEKLMVDPSAWTRWVGEGGQAPPHVYKMLEFFISENVSSDMSSKVFESFKIENQQNFEHELELDRRFDEKLAFVQNQILTLQNSSESHQLLGLGWKILLLVNLFLVIFLFFSR